MFCFTFVSLKQVSNHNIYSGLVCPQKWNTRLKLLMRLLLLLLFLLLLLLLLYFLLADYVEKGELGFYPHTTYTTPVSASNFMVIRKSPEEME